MSLLAHVFHVCADQHFAQFYEIAMGFVFDLNDSLKNTTNELSTQKYEREILPKDIAWLGSFCCPISQTQCCQRQQMERGCSLNCWSRGRFHRRLGKNKSGRRLLAALHWFLPRIGFKSLPIFGKLWATTYLELLQFGLGDRVSFGDDRNNVDFGVEFLHAN